MARYKNVSSVIKSDHSLLKIKYKGMDEKRKKKKQLWNEERIMKYQNRVKSEDFVATEDIKEVVEELSLA